MKVTFTGKQEKLTPPQERKLAMAFSRLSKMLERRGEKDIFVTLTTQRHLHRAEVRLNFYDQALAAEGSATEQFNSIMEALDKMEKQAIKNRTKWRDTKRSAGPNRKEAAAETISSEPPKKTASRAAAKSRPAKVVRADSRGNGKPMTVDEAMMAMEDSRDYMVYRDTDSDKVHVLIRRRDGKVDLIEA
jgi:putative sigma-54 modulation protein